MIRDAFAAVLLGCALVILMSIGGIAWDILMLALWGFSQ